MEVKPCHGLWWLLRWRRLLQQNSTSLKSGQVAVLFRTMRKGTAQYWMTQTCLPFLRVLCNTLIVRVVLLYAKHWRFETLVWWASVTLAAVTSVGVGVSPGAAFSKPHPKKAPRGSAPPVGIYRLFEALSPTPGLPHGFPHGFPSSRDQLEMLCSD